MKDCDNTTMGAIIFVAGVGMVLGFAIGEEFGSIREKQRFEVILKDEALRNNYLLKLNLENEVVRLRNKIKEIEPK